MSIRKQIELMDKLMVRWLEYAEGNPSGSAAPVYLDRLFKAQKHLYETVCLVPYVESSLKYREKETVFDAEDIGEGN